MRHDGLWRARGDRGAVPVATLVIAMAVAGGLLVGGILGFTGALDLFGESDIVAASSAAPYYECPGDNTVAGWLHRGDRVLATGRTAEPSFVQVRSPRSSDARVWIAVEYLEPDADLQALPILPCAVVVDVAVGSTTTTVPGETTTTTSVGETTTTVVDTTTTTLAPPSVGQISESEDPIWESYNGQNFCSVLVGDPPSTSVISAPITAPAGVQSVMMLWSVGDESGSVSMTLSSGQYRATLGPFDAQDPDVVPTGQFLTVTVTVRVTDTLGRVANRQTTVTLNDCNFF